jgi:hypothetical protein
MSKHEKPEREVTKGGGKHESVRQPKQGSGISKHGKPGHNATEKKGK